MKNPKAVAALLLAAASRYKIYERGRRLHVCFGVVHEGKYVVNE